MMSSQYCLIIVFITLKSVAVLGPNLKQMEENEITLFNSLHL